MKKTLVLLCCVILWATSTATAQQTPSPSDNANVATPGKSVKTSAPRKRGPIFRANQEQVSQAVKILRDRQMYSGEDSKKLTPDIRAGLKKYQQAEGVKPTGTLNKATLEKMNIALTDKQKAM